jgi:hypothetical protein
MLVLDDSDDASTKPACLTLLSTDATASCPSWDTSTTTRGLRPVSVIC